MTPEPPIRRIRWDPACRIVPTRFPTIYLFDRVAEPSDFDALYALEALTNDRVRDEVGVIELVPQEDRIVGPGTGPIMAAFTHLNPAGSRFSDGSFGVLYAARDRDTAIAETRFHQARFLAATQEGPIHLQMRLYHLAIDAQLHDLRRRDERSADEDRAIHDPESWAGSQAIAARLRAGGSAGVAYRSVRHAGGQCVGLFKPRGARRCQHAAHLLYAWDGTEITDVFERDG